MFIHCFISDHECQSVLPFDSRYWEYLWVFCHQLGPYSIWPNIYSISLRIRIWIFWQIKWSGFVDVVGSDIIVICLRLWYCDFASEFTSKLGSSAEWTDSLNLIRIWIWQIEYGLGVWSSGNALVLINLVHRARLVWGWVTIRGLELHSHHLSI